MSINIPVSLYKEQTHSDALLFCPEKKKAVFAAIYSTCGYRMRLSMRLCHIRGEINLKDLHSLRRAQRRTSEPVVSNNKQRISVAAASVHQ